VKSKGNAKAHGKTGSLKQTVWQLQGAKVRQSCCKKLPCSQAAFREGYRQRWRQFSSYCPSQSSETIHWALNYEIKIIQNISVKFILLHGFTANTLHNIIIFA
jgi:hypothetical protein